MSDWEPVEPDLPVGAVENQPTDTSQPLETSKLTPERMEELFDQRKRYGNQFDFDVFDVDRPREEMKRSNVDRLKRFETREYGGKTRDVHREYYAFNGQAGEFEPLAIAIFKVGDDGDYHLVLSEINIPSSITMIGEIPNPDCPTVKKSKYFR